MINAQEWLESKFPTEERKSKQSNSYFICKEKDVTYHNATLYKINNIKNI